MALSLVTPPKDEPILLAEAKDFLRVTDAASDSLIASLITACRQDLEGRHGWLGRVFLAQTWDETLDAFPCGDGVVKLSLAPVTEILSVKYLDNDGVEQTLAASAYRADLISEPARLAPAYGLSWPSTRPVLNAVTIRFKAGHAKASEVPEELRLGLKAMVAHFYEHREPVTPGGLAEVPMHAQRILERHRVWV